jgi:hypothetical protein
LYAIFAVGGARRRPGPAGSVQGPTVSLGAPDEDERLVVIGVAGVHRPAGVSRVAVRLVELDAHLLATYGKGLAETLGEVRDRPGERRREALGRGPVR